MIALAVLKEPAVFPLNLFQGVASHDLEGGVDVDEGKIGLGGAGDGDAAGDRGEDAAVELELFHRGVDAAGEGTVRVEEEA